VPRGKRRAARLSSPRALAEPTPRSGATASSAVRAEAKPPGGLRGAGRGLQLRDQRLRDVRRLGPGLAGAGAGAARRVGGAGFERGGPRSDGRRPHPREGFRVPGAELGAACPAALPGEASRVARRYVSAVSHSRPRRRQWEQALNLFMGWRRPGGQGPGQLSVARGTQGQSARARGAYVHVHGLGRA